MPSVRRVRWAKIRVAAVCIAALAILFVLSFLLTGGTLLEQKVILYLYVPDATGLVQGSLVRVDGINVGKVVRVRLSGSKRPERIVQVIMSVERDRLDSITADSTAEVGTESVIGDKFVDITSHRSRNAVRPGGEVQYLPSTDVMKSLDMRQFEDQLRTIDATLRDIETARNPVGEFIVGDQMYRDLIRRAKQLESGIRAAVNTTSAVGRAIYNDDLYRRIRTPLTELDATLAKMQSSPWLRDAGQYEQFLRAATDLRKSVADLHAGAFFQSDTLYADWNRGLSSLAEKVDEMNASPSFSSTAAYDNLNGWAQEMQTSLREFREHPQKFLRLKVF